MHNKLQGKIVYTETSSVVVGCEVRILRDKISINLTLGLVNGQRCPAHL
jgi:hypothetical protein